LGFDEADVENIIFVSLYIFVYDFSIVTLDFLYYSLPRRPA